MYHRDSIKAMLETKRESESISKNQYVLNNFSVKEIDQKRYVFETPENSDRMVTRSTKRKRGEILTQQQKKNKNKKNFTKF